VYLCDCEYACLYASVRVCMFVCVVICVFVCVCVYKTFMINAVRKEIRHGVVRIIRDIRATKAIGGATL
jgi:hypothetical protein